MKITPDSASRGVPPHELVRRNGWQAGPRADGSDFESILTRMRDGDRDAAAELMSTYGPLIRRRVRGKLGTGMRRLFDSMEILSTVSRRLDRYVMSGRVEAETPQQFWALVYRITDAALVDKVRVYERLNRIESGDGGLAEAIRQRVMRAESQRRAGAELEIDSILRSVRDDTDRHILALWLSGNEHKTIGEFVGISEGAVRVRWHRLRATLRKQLEGNGTDAEAG